MTRTLLKLRYQNLLGQRYLSLTAGAERGPELSPDRTLGTGMTDPGFDLTALFNGFKPLFDTLQPQDVNQFAQNIIDVLQGQGPAVESLLQSTATTARTLAARDQAFSEVLDNLTPVLKNLAAHSDDLDATVQQLRVLMSGLAKERGTFATSVDTLGPLLDSTSGLLRQIRPDLRADVQQLRTTSGTLARNRGDVVEGVRALGSITSNLAQFMSYYSAANIYFCNIGFIVNAPDGRPLNKTSWVGGPGGPYSEVCRPH